MPELSQAVKQKLAGIDPRRDGRPISYRRPAAVRNPLLEILVGLFETGTLPWPPPPLFPRPKFLPPKAAWPPLRNTLPPLLWPTAERARKTGLLRDAVHKAAIGFLEKAFGPKAAEIAAAVTDVKSFMAGAKGKVAGYFDPMTIYVGPYVTSGPMITVNAQAGFYVIPNAPAEFGLFGTAGVNAITSGFTMASVGLQASVMRGRPASMTDGTTTMAVGLMFNTPLVEVAAAGADAIFQVAPTPDFLGVAIQASVGLAASVPLLDFSVNVIAWMGTLPLWKQK